MLLVLQQPCLQLMQAVLQLPQQLLRDLCGGHSSCAAILMVSCSSCVPIAVPIGYDTGVPSYQRIFRNDCKQCSTVSSQG